MKTATIIRDKISGTPFAVLLGSGQNLRVYGAMGQGDTWAQWFRASNLDTSALDNLDVSLVVEKDVQLSPEYIDSISNVFSVENINDIKNIASQKALLVIQHTKSLIGEEPENYEQINEINSEEEIDNWPITDASLAIIDVAYKQIVVDYKAKAFNLDMNRSSVILKAKGARAMWDPNMPGGGGWRCPDDTPFGGQFTNRIGRGCTFGALRRIGRSLMTASLEDITKSPDNNQNLAFPKIYKLGQELENRAIENQKNLQEKYKARVGRRVEKLQKRKAKEQLKAGAITWRQAYQSLEPQISRRNRAKIAAARVAQRVAGDIADSTLNAESRRARRRQGRIVEKSPIQNLQPDVNNPQTIAEVLDTRISDEQREYGGRLNSSISNYGGVIADRAIFGGYDPEKGNFILFDFDEMIDAKGFFANRPLGNHIIGEAKDLPKFISMDEAIYLQGDRLTPGRSLSPKELYASRFSGYNPSTYEKNPQIFGVSGEDASRKQLDNLYKTGDTYSWVTDYDVFRNLTKSAVDYKIPKKFRTTGGRLPENISRQGFYIRKNVTEQSIDENTKFPSLLVEGETFIDLDKMIPQSALPEIFDNIIVADEKNVALYPEFASYDFVTYDEISRMTSSVPITSNWDLLSTRYGDESDWRYVPRNVFEREYKKTTGLDYNSEVRKSTLRDRLANSLRNSAQNILEGRRMNRRLAEDNTSSLAERVDFDLREPNSLGGNPNNPVLEYAQPDSKLKKRESETLREEIGGNPKRPGIISRFLNDETRSREKEEREIIRQLRGKKPRSTQALSEKLAARARRTAKAKEGEIPSLSDYPEYIQNRAYPIDFPRKKEDFLSKFEPSERVDTLGPYDDGTDPVLRDFYQPEIDSGLTTPDFSSKPRPSSTDETLPTSEKWWDDESNWLGLQSLNNFFQTFETHEEIARMRQNSLKDFDKEHQKELEKIYRDWLDEYNDPDIDAPIGGGSNMGKTKELVQVIKSEGDPSLTDNVDGVGYRHTLIATGLPNNPIVYIGDTDAGVAHLLDKQGNHVLTVILGDFQSMGKTGKIHFLAGAKAYEKIIKDGLKPTFRERLAGFKKRKERLDVLPVTLRSRQRQFEKSSTRSGLKHAKTTTGTHLRSNISLVEGTRNDKYFPGAPDVPMNLQTQLINEAKSLADYLEEDFRKLTKNFDKNTPINEDEILDLIDEVAKQDKRKSGVIANNLHNFITLTQIVDSEDINYIQNLKPELRSRLLEVIEDEVDENGMPYTMNFEKISPTGKKIAQRRNFVPYVREGEKSSKPKITPSTPLIVVEDIKPTAASTTIETGPKLQLKADSPELGIVWDNSAGLHLDTNTGQYIEDLSNLELNLNDIYEPIPILEVDKYPEVPTTATGIFPVSYVRLAPGANLDGSAGQGLNDNEDPQKRVVGLAPTFSSSIREFVRSQILTRKKNKSDSLAARILKDKNEHLFGTGITKFDVRGRKPVRNVSEGLGGEQYTISELAGLSSESELRDERLSELDGNYLYRADGEDTLTDILTKNNLTLGELGIEEIDPNQPSDASKMLGSKIKELYFPSHLVGDNENITNPETLKLISSINKALSFDAQVELMSRIADANGAVQGMDEAREKADAAWVNAHKNIQTIYVAASRTRNDALKIINKNPRNKAEIKNYLESGAVAETAELLLQEHFINNPRFLRAATNERRKFLEKQASKRNLRKLQEERRKALRQSGGGIGGRNSGVFDDSPEILDPHGESTQQPTRTTAEIVSLVESHKADSMFVNPIMGLTELTDEQIEVLNNLELIRERQGTGLPGTPYEDIRTGQGAGSQIEAAKLAHFWYYNGYNSLPVLINEDELLNAIAEVDDTGLPELVPITRGLGGASTTNEIQRAQYAADYLRGERFIPGTGGEAAGQGDYYTLNPGNQSWKSVRLNGSTIVTVMPRSAKLEVRESFNRIFSVPRRNVLGNLMFKLFSGYKPQPGDGDIPDNEKPIAMRLISKTGGTLNIPNEPLQWSYGISQLLTNLDISLDSDTGQLDARKIDDLKQAVSELTNTDKDSPGLFTVEGIYKSIQGDRNPSVMRMWATLMLDIVDDDGPQTEIEQEMIASLREADLPLAEVPERIDRGNFGPEYSGPSFSVFSPTENEFNFPRVGADRLRNEAFEKRQEINAWFAQYLDWFVQLTQLLRNEKPDGTNTDKANILHNKKIFNAMFTLQNLNQDIMLALHGVDGVFADGLRLQSVLPSQIWSKLFYDPYYYEDSKQGGLDIDPDRFLLHNRSSAIMLREPVSNTRSLGKKIAELKNKILNRPMTAHRRWENL